MIKIMTTMKKVRSYSTTFYLARQWNFIYRVSRVWTSESNRSIKSRRRGVISNPFKYFIQARANRMFSLNSNVKHRWNKILCILPIPESLKHQHGGNSVSAKIYRLTKRLSRCSIWNMKIYAEFVLWSISQLSPTCVRKLKIFLT